MSSTIETPEKDRDDMKAREYDVDANRGTRIQPADSQLRDVTNNE